MSDVLDEIRDRLSTPIFRAFRPWVTPDGRSPQRDFLQSAATHRVRVYRGGNRTGKTTIGAVDLILRALGWHPFARHRAPIHAWVVAPDWDRVANVVWRDAIKPWLPKEKIRSVDWIRVSEPECPRAIVLTNGSVIEFKSAEARIDKFAGSKIHYLWIDEECDKELFGEMRIRLLDYGGDLALTLTPVRRKLWVQDLEGENEGRTTRLVRASTLDAAAAGVFKIHGVDEAEVEGMLRTYDERERRVRGLGDFAGFEGLVYPDFDKDRHVLRPVGDTLVDGRGEVVYQWPLPADWDRYAAMDFGFSNPGCIPLAVHDPNHDALLVTNVWHQNYLTIDKWVKIAKQLPPTLYPLICDHDAGDRAVLEANGVYTVPAIKDEWPMAGTPVSRRLLETADGRTRLYFVVHDRDRAPIDRLTGRCDAFKAVEEIQGYRFKDRDERKPDPRDEPVKKDDHAMDSIRYMCRYVDAKGGRASALEELGKIAPRNDTWGTFGGNVPPRPR
jgi:phage terminase large subunit-like protein